MVQPPKSSYVTVNGIRLHYLDWGGNGPPILLLHATGFLGRIYRPIARALTAVGHVLSYDQRGQGDSGPSTVARYNWMASFADLCGFLSVMDLQGVLGFGHSAGATLIGALAAERPDLISCAVLVEPVLFIRDDPVIAQRGPLLIARTLKRRARFASVDDTFENFHGKPPFHSWRPDILRDYCEYGTRPDPEGGRRLKCAPETEAAFYQSAREFDGWSAIRQCQAPLLVIFGDSSEAAGAHLRGQVAQELANGRVVTIAGATHFAPMEKPDDIAQMAVQFFADFLNRKPGAPSDPP
jgi:pimeloyl-ACP methyl ester carboxylesterase